MFANAVYHVLVSLLRLQLYGDCDGVLAYHIKKGNYGQKTLDGLNVLQWVLQREIIGLGQGKFDCAFFLNGVVLVQFTGGRQEGLEWRSRNWL